MRVSIVVILLLSLLLCKSKKCDENDEFKDIYFGCVEYIEAYSLSENPEEYNDSHKFFEVINFIGHYTEVNYQAFSNYNVRYHNKESFLEDKEKWLKWYDQNKCKNIQVKVSKVPNLE